MYSSDENESVDGKSSLAEDDAQSERALKVPAEVHAADYVVDLSSLRLDNRRYVTVAIAERLFPALVDSGATMSVVGERVYRSCYRFVKPTKANIRYPNGQVSRACGEVVLTFRVDRHSASLKCVVVPKFFQDVILGMDFALALDLDVRLGRGYWRVREGEWYPFNGLDREETCIMAECAALQSIESEQSEQITAVVRKTLATRNKSFSDIGLIEHQIKLKDEVPVKLKLRRMSPKMWETAMNIVAEWHRDGVIERSSSDYCSVPVLVKKQNSDKYRMCIDYRELNKKTIHDAYPMPSLDSVLDKLRRARYISKIDLKAAYNQIPLEKSCRKYTAFAVPGSGLWQFTKMPFGLVNSPMTWNRLVDHLFGPAYEPYVFYYLDDIIIVTDTFQAHLEWVRDVLSRLMSVGLEINPDKCEFCCERVKYLGYVLDRHGLRVDPDKVKPIVEYPRPENVKELRRFLGIVGWYARFIEGDADMKLPLLRLLRRDYVWTWGEEQQIAFEQLKNALTSAPVLARPDFAKPFIIQCDASGTALGAVLVQEDEKGEHPIVYLSRVLSAPERNYSTSEKECLAILWAIKKLRPYVEGYEFTVITDHSALTWLKNLKDPTGRLARWALQMQQWQFRVIHRKGSMMKVPDALSRMHDENSVASEEITEVAALSFTQEVTDPWYIKMRNEVAKHPDKYRNWRVDGDRLYRYRRDPLIDPIVNPEEHWRLVVPAEFREQVMVDAHCCPSSGHFGIEKTYDRISREYYWIGYYYDILDFVRTCDDCQRHKGVQSKALGLMSSRVVERPWVIVASDLMEFPRSKSGNKYLIVFQDLFTRWIEVKPLRKADGKSVARALEELILFRWETPEYFLSDNGKEFDNKLLASVLQEYGVKHVTTAPYNPQSNAVERSNKTLKTMISIFVKNDHRDWDLHVHEFRHAMNTAVQSSTKMSPAFLNYGRHPTPVKSLRREVEPVKTDMDVMFSL
ncbi:hypothetical protein TKK_0013495 [Trichogramma kaykai]|uniref:RNA-directed DNA polymerase n=1 Tax=Trichogramma kaykai TaxID=54128 RepID=A0ABD2WIW9_9HYME